ncbi:type II toxin-antitoxin system VapC family toxin [Nocardia sp. NPDC127579]|uniref:type II toxin-antitoxin system VapC family toxin n=1 Tax=Nocardia sp. NPDC127579 TaxID=3345402 RepID=UPI003638FEAD
MSDDVVVDACAMGNALIRDDETGIALAKRIGESTCHAPHLIDAEIGSVLRKAERGGLITSDRAVAGIRMAKLLVDERYAHHGWLAADAWALRHTVSFYDGLYAALAARLDIPLLTSDARLSRAPNLPCQVELISS